MNLFSQTYTFGDIATQRELLITTLQITGANSVQIARAIECMEKRVDRFYNGTSKYNGNGELKNV